ncbi:MAG: carotenoid biosynthesis protein [Bacteroidota bacterium]|nr:carotenoid biosynthesis protein [Bacteroidota bacterium]
MLLDIPKNVNGKKYYSIPYLIFFAGAIGHYTESLLSSMTILTPWVLLLSGLMVLILSGEIKANEFIIWFAIYCFITLALEITGVNTGYIFGEYRYGNVLGLKLFGVPLIIAFNWMFIILGAVSISSKISSNAFVVAFLAASMALIFDYVLEPVAINLGYWEWTNKIIPLQNYFAWFMISFLMSLSLKYFGIKISSNIFIHYFIAQLVFFLILNFK